jgi:hypothetical protein
MFVAVLYDVWDGDESDPLIVVLRMFHLESGGQHVLLVGRHKLVVVVSCKISSKQVVRIAAQLTALLE